LPLVAAPADSLQGWALSPGELGGQVGEVDAVRFQ